MNWLDLLTIATIAVSAFVGMRIGLLGAAVTALGVLIGWVIAGQFGDEVGKLFSPLSLSPVWVTLISYALIIGLALFVARTIRSVVLPILSGVTLGISGLVDRAGGAVMGAVIGILVSSIVLTAVSGLGETINSSGEGMIGQVARQVPVVSAAGDTVVEALDESSAAPLLMELRNKLPEMRW